MVYRGRNAKTTDRVRLKFASGDRIPPLKQVIVIDENSRTTLPTGDPAESTASSLSKEFLPDLNALSRTGQLTQSIIDQRHRTALMEGRHRKELHQETAIIYHKALYYRTDRDAWNEFCRHPEWDGVRNRPKPDYNANPLPAVLRLSCGLESKASIKKASLHLRALQPLFDRRLPAEEIVGILELSGGISGLAQQHREEDKRLAAQTCDAAILIRVPRTAVSEALDTLTPDGGFLGYFEAGTIEKGMIEARLVILTSMPRRIGSSKPL